MRKPKQESHGKLKATGLDKDPRRSAATAAACGSTAFMHRFNHHHVLIPCAWLRPLCVQRWPQTYWAFFEASPWVARKLTDCFFIFFIAYCTLITTMTISSKCSEMLFQWALGRWQPLSSSEVSLASKSSRMVWLGACSAPKLRAAALPLGSLRPETGPQKWALICADHNLFFWSSCWHQATEILSVTVVCTDWGRGAVRLRLLQWICVPISDKTSVQT